MKLSLFSVCVVLGLCPVMASNPGSNGISQELMGELRGSYSCEGPTRALRNALNSNDLDKIAKNLDASDSFNMDFSNKVESKGITDQKSSGRCWLFTGLNVLRSQMMAKNDLPALELSQNYNFFYDQLEKSNLFLQGIIDTADKPMDDKMVDWLFSNPLSDGGQYTGLSDNIMKYGVVPAEVMHESYTANNTAKMRRLISLKLREDGLELRKMRADKAKANAIQTRKKEMLKEIYRMLALSLGEPPVEFTWTRKNSKGDVIDTKKYTPLEFYNEYAGNDLKGDYVMLMNDPTREYHKVYEIDYDRHVYDGENWKYINLPIEEIKEIAIKSIKDSTMMYFSCDVGKFFDRDRGVLDLDNFDYESILGVKFGMDKADRIRTHASGSTHAMTLMAVDLDTKGVPQKWMVENSWGKTANNGHVIMTDRWFDEYMFRLVANRKYIPEATLKLLDMKPIMLPAWDPMFSCDN